MKDFLSESLLVYTVKILMQGDFTHLELRQEPQGSAPDFLEPDLTQIAGSLLSLLRSVRSRVLQRNGTPLTSQVVQG